MPAFDDFHVMECVSYNFENYIIINKHEHNSHLELAEYFDSDVAFAFRATILKE